MLRASHFPALSRQMENDFVISFLNVVRTSLVTSAHGLAQVCRRANPQYVSRVDPLDPRVQAKQEGGRRPQNAAKREGSALPDQATKAKARRLEQSRTRPAAVRARKPSETGS
jgi:hypothetical protein